MVSTAVTVAYFALQDPDRYLSDTRTSLRHSSGPRVTYVWLLFSHRDADLAIGMLA